MQETCSSIQKTFMCMLENASHIIKTPHCLSDVHTSPKVCVASRNPPICAQGLIIFCPIGTPMPPFAINDAENVQY